MLSIESGPSVICGNLNPVQNTEPDQGPSLVFQGNGLVDPRLVGQIGAAPGTKVFGIFTNSFISALDGLPVTAAAARISAAANPVAATPFTLVTAQGIGVSPNLSILPFGSAPVSGNLVTVLGIDCGFCSCNTASSVTVTIPAGAWRFFYAGQRIWISGARTATTPLYTTVAATPTPGATTITISTAAGTTANNLQIGTAHPTLDCVWPYVVGGAIAMYDSTQSISRAVSITTAAATGAGNVTVRGYDIYGVPMTEQITCNVGGVQNGKKAFKYIVSATPSQTDATGGHTISVGTSDVMGFSIRSDFFEYLNLFVAGAFITANTGWVVADPTVASATTGDVRGTYALQTGSNWDGTNTNWATTGTGRRSAFFVNLPLYNAVNANNLNYSTLFGNTQF